MPHKIPNDFEHVISVQTVKCICEVELNENLLFAHTVIKVTRSLHSCFAAPRNTNTNLHMAEKNQQAWLQHRRRHIWQSVYAKRNLQ